MMQYIIVATASVAVAFENPMLDEGLSLLQVHSQKHANVQDPNPYYQGPKGTECPLDEVITLAKCLEVQKKGLIPGVRTANIIHNGRSDGIMPTGCWTNGGGGMGFSDQPVGRPHNSIAPICGANGGRAAELVEQDMHCINADCTRPPGSMGAINVWGPQSVVVPEIQVLEKGAVCPEACGILTFEECSKIGDDGTYERATGSKIVQGDPELAIPFGSLSSFPSGCVGGFHKDRLHFNPFDTPSGARVPEFVSDSGVGQGYGNGRPVCKVCTTTTTTTTDPPPPPPAAGMGIGVDAGDEASAVGDPHIHTSRGEVFDLSP